MTPLIIGSAAAMAAATALWLLFRGHRNNRFSGKRSFGRGSANPYSESWEDEDDWYRERLRQEAAERAARESQAVREMLQNGDEPVANLLMELAGLQPGHPRLAAKDDETIRRIAQSVNADTRKVLSFASKSNAQLDKIDLNTRTELQRSPHPADTFEVERMQSDDQLGSVMPEELAMPDDVFFPQFGEDGLHVVQHYEQVEKVRRMYLLIDISGSMNEPISKTEATRIQWAAGVALKLMLKAQAGEAEFLLRYFDNDVYSLRRVTSANEATAMVNELVRLRDAHGGTNIQSALKAAVKDMASSKSDFDTSDLLLITDGESELSKSWLRKTFGSDIRLHVAMIGQHNPVLEKVSTSYQVYV